VKQHEKRAIERAVEEVLCNGNNYLSMRECLSSKEIRKRQAQDAVNLAQDRANRFYDDQTRRQALNYAEALIDPLNQVVITRRIIVCI